MNIDHRIHRLLIDEWAKKVHAKWVLCGGCKKQISLDKRFEFYRGFWDKHRKRCPVINSGVPAPPKERDV